MIHSELRSVLYTLVDSCTLRSPNAGNANNARNINSDGSLNNNNAVNGNGVVVDCMKRQIVVSSKRTEPSISCLQGTVDQSLERRKQHVDVIALYDKVVLLYTTTNIF